MSYEWAEKAGRCRQALLEETLVPAHECILIPLGDDLLLAAFFEKFLKWTEFESDAEGWVPKTLAEIRRELTWLSAHLFRRLRDALAERGFLEYDGGKGTSYRFRLTDAAFDFVETARTEHSRPKKRRGGSRTPAPPAKPELIPEANGKGPETPSPTDAILNGSEGESGSNSDGTDANLHHYPCKFASVTHANLHDSSFIHGGCTPGGSFGCREGCVPTLQPGTPGEGGEHTPPEHKNPEPLHPLFEAGARACGQDPAGHSRSMGVYLGELMTWSMVHRRTEAELELFGKRWRERHSGRPPNPSHVMNHWGEYMAPRKPRKAVSVKPSAPGPEVSEGEAGEDPGFWEMVRRLEGEGGKASASDEGGARP